MNRNLAGKLRQTIHSRPHKILQLLLRHQRRHVFQHQTNPFIYLHAAAKSLCVFYCLHSNSNASQWCDCESRKHSSGNSGGSLTKIAVPYDTAIKSTMNLFAHFNFADVIIVPDGKYLCCENGTGGEMVCAKGLVVAPKYVSFHPPTSTEPYIKV